MKQILNLFILIIILAGCQADDVSNPQNNQESSQPVQEEMPVAKFPDENLEKTDEGSAVEQLQAALNEIGYDIEISGVYDDTTTWAITDFQLQQENVHPTGVYDEQTRELLTSVLEKEQKVEAGKSLPEPTEPVFSEYGTQVIANPYDQLALVNKEHALPEDYIPEDLVIPDVPFPFTEELPKMQMREIAAEALEEMFQAADEAGLDLYAQSGYRSFERQDVIFTMNAEKDGEEEANQYSARPGESEHQTGLTMDVTSPDVNYELVEEFGETDEGKWVEENAASYGFIIRYPKGKEDITQYQYEPWHLRYVGKKAAEKMMSEGMTLEEYLGAAE